MGFITILASFILGFCCGTGIKGEVIIRNIKRTQTREQVIDWIDKL